MIAYLDPTGARPGPRCVAMVEAGRRSGEQITREHRYYLSSVPGDAAAVGAAVRGRWGIENRWRAGPRRPEPGAAAPILALVSRCSRASAKIGVKAKRLKAGWDEAYLLRALGQ